MKLDALQKPEPKGAKPSVPTTAKKPEEAVAAPRYLAGEPAAAPVASVPRYLAPEAKASPAVGATALGPAEPLPASTAARMGKAFGQDLSDVRVHPQSVAPGAQGARALTTGRDIAFAAGEYKPGTTEGDRLIAHEVAHVAQQAAGKTGVQRKSDAPADTYEKEADAAADVAVAGGEVGGVTPLGGGAVQAKPAEPGAAAGAVAGEAKAKPGKAGQGEVDLSRMTIDPTSVTPDARGKVMARLPGMAEGEITVTKGTGGALRTKGRGSAIPLTIPALDGVLGGNTVLVVVIDDNKVSGYAALGSPGAYVARNDSKLFGGATKAPGAVGLGGMSKISIKSPKNALMGGTLELGAEIGFTLGGWVEGSGSLVVAGDELKASGEAELKIPGGSGGKLKVERRDKTGLAGEVGIAVAFGKVSGSVMARLKGEALDVQGTVGYAGDKLKGSITLMAADAETARNIHKTDPQAGQFGDAGGAAGGTAPGGDAGAAGGAAAPGAGPSASAKPGPREFCGWGDLDFTLTEWLVGRAKVVVSSSGEATVKGEIAPPKEIILFEQKDWVKPLVKAEARAPYGLPVIGNVFMFANIGLEALATIGPGKLYNIKMSGQYSTDPKVDQELNLQASLNISAFAGLRLRAEGGVGLQILAHDVKAGVGVWALAGVKGYVEATPSIGYRSKGGGPGEFYFKGHMELAARPFLGLGGDLFVEVASPWYSPLPSKKWTWPMGSIEYPLPGEFGIGADVEYVLGQKKWPEVKFTEVEFDSGKFMGDLLSPGAGGGGKGKGDGNKPGKWSDGGAKGAPGNAGGGAKGPAAGGGKPAAGGSKPAAGGGKGKGGGKPGKDKKGQDKGLAQVGTTVSFGANGKNHMLAVKGTGKNVKLVVSTPDQSVPAWLGAQESRLGSMPKDAKAASAKHIGEARSLASQVERDAQRLATEKGDKKQLEVKNGRIKKEQQRLAGLLKQVLAVRTPGGDDKIGEVVTFQAGKESHRLWITVSGKKPVVMVASAPAPAETQIARLRADASKLTDAKRKARAEEFVTGAQSALDLTREVAQKEVNVESGAGGAAGGASATASAKTVAAEKRLGSALGRAIGFLGHHGDEVEAPKILKIKAAELGKVQTALSPMLYAAKNGTQMYKAGPADPKVHAYRMTVQHPGAAAFDKATGTLTLPGPKVASLLAGGSAGQFGQIAGKESLVLTATFERDKKKFKLKGAVGSASTILADGSCEVEKRLETAVGGNLMTFLLALAEHGSAGGLTLAQVNEMCESAVNFGWLKDEFREVKPYGHHHEWIPSNFLLQIVQHAHQQKSVVGFTRAARWIKLQNEMRTDTKWVIFKPAYAKVVTEAGKSYAVLQGHSGAIYFKEKKGENQQTKQQGPFHDELRACFGGGGIPSIPATIDIIISVFEKYIWMGESHTHPFHPDLLDGNGVNISKNPAAAAATQLSRWQQMYKMFLRMKARYGT